MPILAFILQSMASVPVSLRHLYRNCGNMRKFYQDKKFCIFQIFDSFRSSFAVFSFSVIKRKSNLLWLWNATNKSQKLIQLRLRKMSKNAKFLYRLAYKISAIPIQMPQIESYRCHRLKNGCQNIGDSKKPRVAVFTKDKSLRVARHSYRNA